MIHEDLAYATIAEIAPLIRRRDVSSVELTELTLERINRINPSLNAFITVTGEQALGAAQVADREIAAGHYRGPLHGIPISLKDLYGTAGTLTTAGSRILADFRPERDATVTRRLAEAGAILVGKTNMHEFAYGTTTINPHYGAARNPWNSERITAGSSGGTAAAVAAGLSYMSMGSETGWSIRRPAAFCGVVGLKATYGRVSRAGVLPLAWSLDHAGPLTRSVTDAGLALNAIAGYDPEDPASSRAPVPDFNERIGLGVQGIRIGIPRDHVVTEVQPEVADAFAVALDTLRGLGAVSIDLALHRVQYTGLCSQVIMAAEASAVHARWLRERGPDYGDDVRERLELGLAISAVDHVRAMRLRRWIAEEVTEAFAKVDVMVCPTSPQVASTVSGGAAALGDPSPSVAAGPFNLLRLFALLGIPAIALPCGFSSDGLPISLTVAARAFDEQSMLRVAGAYERATAWHRQRPNVRTN